MLKIGCRKNDEGNTHAIERHNPVVFVVFLSYHLGNTISIGEKCLPPFLHIASFAPPEPASAPAAAFQCPPLPSQAHHDPKNQLFTDSQKEHDWTLAYII